MHSQDEDTLDEDNFVEGGDSSVPLFSSQSDYSQHQPSVISPHIYADLLKTIKNQLQEGDLDEVNGDRLSEDIKQMLHNISLLINQSFATVSTLLQKQETGEISTYLGNSALVLSLFGRYLKRALSVEEAPCEMFSMVPTVAATIVRDVFAHCKTSESLYGAIIHEVEGELKDLFKACHDLQIVYQDILQNRIVFQTEQEIEVLVSALKINVEIGEIVIALDVKTMAEQWKCFSAICERYSEELASEDVVEICVNTLASVVLENIQSCLEENQEQKALLRLLKVTNFLMKIVIKMCQVFKHRVLTDYAAIVKLLIAMKGMDARLAPGCTPHHRELLRSHVTVSADPLLAQLLDNADFAETLLNTDPLQECKPIGNILLLASVMALLLRRDDEATLDLWLQDSGNIVCVALSWLPKCTSDWLNEGLKLDIVANRGEKPLPCGLLEYLVPLTSAISVRSSPQQFLEIEEAVLSTLVTTDCEWTALFVCDLWVVIARFAPSELCVEQITYLAGILKRLHKLEGTSVSPKTIRLSTVTRRLFCTLDAEDRLKLYRAFSLDDEENNSIWIAIRLSNLPDREARMISDEVFNKLENYLQRFLKGNIRNGKDFYKLIETSEIAATGIPSQSVPAREILRCWCKCYGNTELGAVIPSDGESAPGVSWFYHLVAALLRLTTMLLQNKILNNEQLIQIIEVLSSIVEKSTTFKLNSILLLRELANYNISADSYADPLCDHIAHLFHMLLQDCDLLVKARTFEVFKYFSIHTNVENIIVDVVKSDEQLRDLLVKFLKNGHLNDFDDLKVNHCVKFTHKCTTSKTDCVTEEEQLKDSLKSNFEFGDIDIDMILDNSELENSPSKRMKMSHEEVDIVLSRLESDSKMLQTVNLSVENKNRVKSLIVRLQNIIS